MCEVGLRLPDPYHKGFLFFLLFNDSFSCLSSHKQGKTVQK